MSSTYSSYKIELIGTGEQAGTWGTTTNTNLGTALEQAIGGYVSVAFTGLTKTLTLTNTNAAQDARALYLNLTGTPGGTATLELPAIQKAYIIKNSTTGGFSVIAKVTGMTGVVIPNGSTMTVYNNGTDVVVANNNFNDGLTLGTTVLSANSASDALRITQLGSGNALVVEDEANPDSSRFQIDSTGRVSIGTTTPGVSNLRISRTLTGGTSGASVYLDYTVASDVTGSASSYRSDVTTQATAFTLPFLTHYTATGLTVGAGSTVTDQRAFNVSSGAVGATSNYGFYSILPAAANNWNLYLPGTANNYMAGALGIGSTTLAGYKIRTGSTLDGSGGGAADIFTNSTIQSSVTTIYYGHRSLPVTQATAFTLGSLYHFIADSLSVGAGSTVTTQVGFYATGLNATTNYGFFGSVASGSTNWNFYGQGTANNYLAGALGIGSTTLTGYNLRINRQLTGATTAFGISQSPEIQSDVTTAVYLNLISATTQAAAFTLPNLYIYSARGATIGAGSTLTNQYGYLVEANLNTATNNFGVYSSVPSTANNWNFYANGTANNYLAGALGIGTTTVTNNKLRVGGLVSSTGTGFNAISANMTFDSTVTGTAVAFISQPATQATSFTITSLYHYLAQATVLGAGSSITNQYGIQLNDFSGGATNNYGISSTLAGGANNWNLYASGGANNYMAGALGIGTTVVGGYNFRISRNLTGGVSGSSFSNDFTALSDVTSNVHGIYSAINTQDAVYTLTNLNHFTASGGTRGASSAITYQYGFHALSTLSQATNNYGFYGNVAASGSNNWNFYAQGTAPNYMAGALGIGSANVVNLTNLRISRNLTGGATQYSIMNQPQFMSDVTTQAVVYRSFPSTEAAAFTLASLSHYVAENTTIGAGSAITLQFGFYAGSNLTGAAQNFGFYSDIAAAANRWNFYANGTANNYMAGALGIGQTSLTGFNLRISRNLTGATNATSISNGFVVQSDVTLAAYGYRSFISTQATAFTLPDLFHYAVEGGTAGAGSTITNQSGFAVISAMTSATNNFGFVSSLAAAANRWNLYINGTANNYIAGALGIGSTSLAGYNLAITRQLTGATTQYSVGNQPQFMSDVTSLAVVYRSFPTTQAAAFTIPLLTHYIAENLTVGAGSTVSVQAGFYAGANLTGATTNYGFYSDIASAANRWNFYASGTANNYMAGSLGIGSTSLTGYGLRVGKNLTGALVSYQVSANYTVQSDVSGARTFQSAPSTQATAFTLGSLYHFVAEVPGVGAGSTITNQYAFLAASGLEVATNNYGFGSSIASGANNWNIYSSGTAKNYLAGALGIGTTSSTASLAVNRNLTGAASNSQVVCSYTVLSDVTSNAYTFESLVQTQASATLGNLIHYHVSGLIPGGGSTITNQYGIQIDDISGATNNYGVYSNLTSGSSRWNFYGQGTANNAFRGNSRFGGLTAPVATVDVTGNVAATTSILSTGATSGVGYAAGAGGAVTQLTSRTTGVTLNNVSGAITLVSAAGSTAYQTFTVTNSAVAATDVVIVNQKSGTDKYITMVTTVAAGSFQITFATTGGTTTEQPVFNFAVIKAVAA